MKVFVVEDAPQTRRELVELLAAAKGLEVIGQAGSVREALKGIETTAPGAVILDISLPDGSGVEVLKHIHSGNPYERLRAKCQQLGAAAVLDKFDGLAQAARTLLEVGLSPTTR
jgi:DNA-binding NarL/FixJ family response regulator